MNEIDGFGLGGIRSMNYVFDMRQNRNEKNGTNPSFVKELETWTRKNEGEIIGRIRKVIVIRLPACRTDENMNCKFT